MELLLDLPALAQQPSRLDFLHILACLNRIERASAMRDGQRLRLVTLRWSRERSAEDTRLFGDSGLLQVLS